MKIKTFFNKYRKFNIVEKAISNTILKYEYIIITNLKNQEL